jgi:prepilin-type N-terminal cleavage/methylation domain-containing protein
VNPTAPSFRLSATLPVAGRAVGADTGVLRPGRGSPGGFTLLELILVLALLLTVVGFAAPTLARFFRGRGLDSEAQRFLALTRYGQSRAVAEGIPMVVWADPEQRLYGLEAEFTYTEYDDRAIEFPVDDELEMEVGQLLTATALAQELPNLPTQPALPNSQRSGSAKDLILLRFTPDGGLGTTNPEWVSFRRVHEGDEDSTLWVAQSRTRLSYEIRTNEPPLLRR